MLNCASIVDRNTHVNANVKSSVLQQSSETLLQSRKKENQDTTALVWSVNVRRPQAASSPAPYRVGKQTTPALADTVVSSNNHLPQQPDMQHLKQLSKPFIGGGKQKDK